MIDTNTKMVWNYSIVVLSWTVAFVGSYLAASLCENYRLSVKFKKNKQMPATVIVILMAISVGGVAVWGMHFIGMQAMTLKTKADVVIPVCYKVDLTIASLISVIVLGYMGFFISSMDKSFTQTKTDIVGDFIEDCKTKTIKELRNLRSANDIIYSSLTSGWRYVLVGGVLTASGVCIMHYVGMAAMEFEGRIHWDAGIVVASLLIAMVASIAALWILYRFISVFPRLEWLRIASAFVMAIAVNGMHYTGMAAASYEYIPGKSSSLSSLSGCIPAVTAFTWAIVASVIVCILIAMATLADTRAWSYDANTILAALNAKLEQIVLDDSKEVRQQFMTVYKKLHKSDQSYTSNHSALGEMFAIKSTHSKPPEQPEHSLSSVGIIAQQSIDSSEHIKSQHSLYNGVQNLHTKLNSRKNSFGGSSGRSGGTSGSSPLMTQSRLGQFPTALLSEEKCMEDYDSARSNNNSNDNNV